MGTGEELKEGLLKGILTGIASKSRTEGRVPVENHLLMAVKRVF